MNRFKFVLPVVLILAGICWAAQATAAEDQPMEKGFVSLFNGLDLTGWEGDARFWSVKDGAIRGETTEEKKAEHNTFIMWREGKLKNFILKIKFRIQNGNAGVQYRSKDNGDFIVSGYQAEVCNEQPQVGFLYDERGRASLVNVGEFVVIDEEGKIKVVSKTADADQLMKEGYYKPTGWNEYTIYARGNHIIHVLNGRQTIELIDRDPKGRHMDGILALQIHQGPPMVVEYKDIYLKNLDAEFGDAVMLFNGENLDGWTPSSDELKDTFVAKDGLIDISGKPAGYLRTVKEYTSYNLTLQLKHIKAGNNGVLLRKVGPDKVWPRSIEAQGQKDSMGDIWNIDEFPMKVAEDRTEGRHTTKEHPSNEYPVGEWNRYDIFLNGGDLNLRVNDLIQNVATDCWVTPGTICLQSEGTPAQFRNLVLLPIK